jgi:hypothetical protein
MEPKRKVLLFGSGLGLSGGVLNKLRTLSSADVSKVFSAVIGRAFGKSGMRLKTKVLVVADDVSERMEVHLTCAKMPRDPEESTQEFAADSET